MRCTEICSKDTLFIHNAMLKIKKLSELEVEIQCNKYKYINTPRGVKLLIEGNKVYKICYIGNTKQQVIGKTFKVPFCSVIPINSKRCGYKSIEFIVKELKILEINQIGITTVLSFNIVGEENYNQQDIEIMNSQVMNITADTRAITYGLENYEENNKLIGYLICGDRNIQVAQLLILSLAIYVYFNQNKLR